MHPLVEKIIRQLSENVYLVKMKNGDIAVWRNIYQQDEEGITREEWEDLLLSCSG